VKCAKACSHAQYSLAAMSLASLEQMSLGHQSFILELAQLSNDFGFYASLQSPAAVSI
jgi:hypothetical protein